MDVIIAEMYYGNVLYKVGALPILLACFKDKEHTSLFVPTLTLNLKLWNKEMR